MQRCFLNLWRVGTVLLLCSIGCSDIGWADDVPNRKYSAGPLTATDFLAPPDPTTPRWAKIKTDLRFDFRYQYEQKADNVELWITQAEAFALVDCAASWNKRPLDAELMAHEQGHFDLAHRQALLLTREFRRRIKLKDATFRVQADEIESAVAKLQTVLLELTNEYAAQLQEEDETYDEKTKNGMELEAQEAWRKKILAEIEELQAAVEIRREPKR